MRFVAVSVLFGLVNPVLGATIIDFEDWTGGSGDQTSITYDGFTFSGSFFIAPDPDGGNPSMSLHTRAGYLEIAKANGGTFSIASIDLQEGLPEKQTEAVTLTAFRDGGVVDKEHCYLDGVADTYETFHPIGQFWTHFVDIEYLWLRPGYGQTFSLDNIVIPEPITLCLMALALFLPLKPRS